MVGCGVGGKGCGLVPLLAGDFTSSPCCGSPGLVGTREDSRFLGCSCGRHNANAHPSSGSRRGRRNASGWWGSRRAPSPPALLGAMRRDLDGSSAYHPRERGLLSSSTVTGPTGLSVEMPEAPAARACSRAISFLREGGVWLRSSPHAGFLQARKPGRVSTQTQRGFWLRSSPHAGFLRARKPGRVSTQTQLYERFVFICLNRGVYTSTTSVFENTLGLPCVN